MVCSASPSPLVEKGFLLNLRSALSNKTLPSSKERISESRTSKGVDLKSGKMKNWIGHGHEA